MKQLVILVLSGGHINYLSSFRGKEITEGGIILFYFIVDIIDEADFFGLKF